MKKLIYIGLLYLVGSCKSGQKNKEQPIAQLPIFNVLLLDSTTLLNSAQLPSGSPTLIVYFQPDCEHCNETVKILLQHIERFKDVKMLFLSPVPVTELKSFAARYDLKKYKNITIGRDYQYSFYKQFKPSVVPYTTIYDRENNLVKVYSGEIIINAILDAMHI